MSSTKLSKEEKQIESDLARGRFKALDRADVRRYAAAAQLDVKRRKAARKEARINIRLTADQLLRLRERAEQEGLPYQSLVGSLIQKYLNGSLVDVTQLATIKKTLRAV